MAAGCRGSWRAAALGLAGLVAAAACQSIDGYAPRRRPLPGAEGGGGGLLFEQTGGSGGSTIDTGLPDVLPDEHGPCDEDLALDDADPMNAARAVDLCKVAEDDDDWGIASAAWVKVDGSAAGDSPTYHLGHGLLEAFGDTVGVLRGERMLALSSGTARQPTDEGYASPAGFDKAYASGAPEGFPKESQNCPGVVTGPVHDDVALELVLRAPPKAEGFYFRFHFYTYEWPVFICSQFNDFFVALLDPVPKGQDDGNIAFDAQGNPVSVNSVFVRACACEGGPPCAAPPGEAKKTYDCDLGFEPLAGTGFEGHASTGWLLTQAPVKAGATFKLRFGAYDSGDGVLDSTTLIDDFRWLGSAGDGPSTKPDVPK